MAFKTEYLALRPLKRIPLAWESPRQLLHPQISMGTEMRTSPLPTRRTTQSPFYLAGATELLRRKELSLLGPDPRESPQGTSTAMATRTWPYPTNPPELFRSWWGMA